MAKKQLTKTKAFEYFWNYGFFYGWEKIVKEYEPDRKEAASFKADLYRKLLDEVAEAKKEATRLQGLIGRLEQKCLAGIPHGGADPMKGWDATASNLRLELEALDGWVMSLLESNVTLLHYIQNPETAGNRVRALGDAFGNLAARRAKERRLFESDPKQFQLVQFFY